MKISNAFKNRFKQSKFIYSAIFILTGLASTIWFLIRVIPKPSRASYPCMQAASPLMASFVVYILSITGSLVFFRKFRNSLINKNYRMIPIIFFLCLFFGILSFSINTFDTKAETLEVSDFTANEPVGTAVGINPGEVVWLHDKTATNINCTNKDGDYWWKSNNTDQVVIQKMLDEGIQKVASKTNVKDAWNAIFKYHNIQKGRGDKSYTNGEKIMIKLNFNPSYGKQDHNFETRDQVSTSPQLILALLKQLVNELGVNQTDITVGDVYRAFPNIHYDMLHAAFPDVHYTDNVGGDGREQTKTTTEKLFFTSDPENSFSSVIPICYVEAAYFINIPIMKNHEQAGITLAAKNHQGSVRPSDGNVNNLMTNDLHYCFPTSPGYKGMGKYRHLVDYMGHEFMGGNTALNIVDAIWSGNASGGKIEKWYMTPFKGDYTSSLFISQDRVAIEAVCYDFLYEEWSTYRSKHSGSYETYPTTLGVNDYLVQAADPSQWAVQYDPENDGTKLKSMGVYERWNNALSKQYSQNLGKSYGIRLTTIPEVIAVTGVNLDKTSAIIKIAENVTLTASVTPDNASIKEVKWTTSDSRTATVSSAGVVTGKAVGIATITATTTEGGKTATATITVEGIAVTGVNLDKTSAIIKIAENVTLTASVTPDNASVKEVKWTTSDSKTATVSSAGVVTGKAVGIATITATTTEGSKTATATITVEGNVGVDTKEVSSVEVYPNPTSGDFTVKLSSIVNANVAIYTTEGRLVYNAKTDDRALNISLKSGIYIVKVYDEKGLKASQKLVVFE